METKQTVTRTYRYQGFIFHVKAAKDGWYHLTAGVEPNEADCDDWNGPFEDIPEAASDAAERIDLALS
jgi:hypothetical protein